MNYTFNRLVTGANFDEVDAHTRKALADKGFGVLTEIDVKATMKSNPWRLQSEDGASSHGIEPRVGAMLPCNVILREAAGGVEVSAIDPVASMQAIDNPALQAVAGQMGDLLAEAVAAI